MAATTKHYISSSNRQRLNARHFVAYGIDGSKGAAATFKPSAFARLRGCDGQSLAGTGALVFEGEVLERAPR